MHRRTVRAIIAVAVASSLSSLVSIAGAQTGRPRGSSAEPDYWIGVSVGYTDGMSMTDNASQTRWDFGSSTQIRATLEKKLDAGVTGGIAAGFSTAPLTYSPAVPPPGGISGCAITSCQAKADINQYVVFIRGGGGPGFHALYNFEGGVTKFANFREDSTSNQLPPVKGGYDLTFGVGGGFAYGLSTTADIYVGEAWDFILHKQLANTSSSAPRPNTLRAGMRLGF